MMSAAWRGAIGVAAMAMGLAWLGPAPPAAAQAWKPDRPVEIIVGTDPGSGNDPLSYRDLTSVALLLNEEIALGVYGGSAIKTGQDLIARLKQDPTSVSFAVSG